jgi:hypothetical protein
MPELRLPGGCIEQKTLKKILHWQGYLINCASAFPGMGAEISEKFNRQLFFV